MKTVDGAPGQIPLTSIVTCTTADTEYEFAVPAGTHIITAKWRNSSHTGRINLGTAGEVAVGAADDVYFTIPAAGAYYDGGLDTNAGLIMYVACDTNGGVLEIISWS